METFDLAGKVVLITGGARGIGFETAKLAYERGASVVLVDLDPEVAAESAESIGEGAIGIGANVAVAEEINAAVQSAVEQLGRVDVVIANAGITPRKTTTRDISTDEWERVVEVNLLGPVYMSMAAIPELRGRNGRIVNVSSGAAHHVIVAASAYCAAKAALNQFNRVLAAEEPDLTVIAVRPGVVDTRMQELLRSEGPAKMPPEQAAFYKDLKTAGRLEPPQVPARAIAWLALHAPREWSGAFMSYDDPQIAEPAFAAFGERYLVSVHKWPFSAISASIGGIACAA